MEQPIRRWRKIRQGRGKDEAIVGNQEGPTQPRRGRTPKTRTIVVSPEGGPRKPKIMRLNRENLTKRPRCEREESSLQPHLYRRPGVNHEEAIDGCHWIKGHRRKIWPTSIIFTYNSVELIICIAHKCYVITSEGNKTPNKSITVKNTDVFIYIN